MNRTRNTSSRFPLPSQPCERNIIPVCKRYTYTYIWYTHTHTYERERGREKCVFVWVVRGRENVCVHMCACAHVHARVPLSTQTGFTLKNPASALLGIFGFHVNKENLLFFFTVCVCVCVFHGCMCVSMCTSMVDVWNPYSLHIIC